MRNAECGMALKVQRGGGHFDSVHSEHATADSASCSLIIPVKPSQQNRTLSHPLWLWPQAALGYSHPPYPLPSKRFGNTLLGTKKTADKK